MVEAGVAADLDDIVISDHDEMSNIQTAKEIAPPSLSIIPGVEVSTSTGHMLAVDFNRPPAQTGPISVARDIQDQGGFAIPAHPFDTFRDRSGSSFEELVDIEDAIETVNSRCLREAYNHQAHKFAVSNSLPRTGGSDAHFPVEVGRAVTVAEEPLLAALENHKVKPSGMGRYISGHIHTKVHESVQAPRHLREDFFGRCVEAG